jgi:hypothetical protein
MSWFQDNKRAVYDVLERAGKSFLQVGVGVAFLSVTPDNMFSPAAWYQAVGVGLGAALVSVVLSLVTWKVRPLGYWPDIAIRMVRTFLGSLVASWGATVGPFDVFHFSWHDSLALAFSVMIASLVTNIATTNASVVDNAGKSASLAYGAVPVTERQEAKLYAKAERDAAKVPTTGVAPSPTRGDTELHIGDLTPSTVSLAGRPTMFNSMPEGFVTGQEQKDTE